MKTRLPIPAATLSLLALGLTATTSTAQQILQPTSATTSLTTMSGFGAVRTINQSGFATPYISGVTDFAAFVAATAHPNSNPASLLANSNGLNQPNGVVAVGETITFDLGSVQGIDAIAVWSTSIASEALAGFALYPDIDDNFTNGTGAVIGIFQAVSSGAGQPFSFAPVATRFVHIELTTVGGGNFLRLGEVAFRRAGAVIGTGCVGSGGGPKLAATSSALRSGSFSSELIDGATLGAFGGLAAMMFGDAALPQPLDLGFAGSPGCSVFVDGVAILQFATLAGTGTFSLQIPASTGLVGSTFFQQALDLDPTANALGLTTSNAISFTVL